MANYLAELPWRQLTGKLKLKDATLGKALAKLDVRADLAARLAALEECRAAALALSKDKKFTSNPEVKEYLEEVADAVAKECSAVEAAKRSADKKAAATAKREEDEDDEEEDDEGEQEEGDFASRLLKGLSQVKTGGGKVALPFAVGVGSTYAVLVSKRVSSQDKKDLMQLAGGKKVLKGTCTWENGKYTFIQDKVQAGLASKLQKGLKDRFKVTAKVRVRDVEGKTAFDGDTDVDADPQDPTLAGREAGNGQETAPSTVDLQATLDRIVAGIRTAMGLKNPKMGAKLKDATLAASEASKLLNAGQATAGVAVEKAKKLLAEAIALGGGSSTSTPGTKTGEPSREAEDTPDKDVSAGSVGYEAEKAKVDADILRIEAAVRTLEGLKHADADKYKRSLKAIRKKYAEAEAIANTDDAGATAKMSALATRAQTDRVAAEAKATTEANTDAAAKLDAEDKLKRWATDKLALLKAKPTAVAAEIAAVEANIATIKGFIAKRFYKQAVKLSGNVFFYCKSAQVIADAHGAYVTRKAAVDARISDLKGKPNQERIPESLSAMDDKVAKAAACAALDRREFDAASKLLDEADGLVTYSAKMLAEGVEYDAAKAALEKTVAALEGGPQAALVKTQTDLVRSRLAAAQDLADGGQYAEGKALLDKAQAECDAAAKIATAQAGVAKEHKSAEKSIKGGDQRKAVATVEAMVKALKARPGADLIAKELEAIDQWMLEATGAVKGKKPEIVKKALTTAADACVAADLARERRLGFGASADAADQRVQQLEAIATKTATDAAKSIRTKLLDAAKALAEAGKFDEALAKLDLVDAECAAAEKKANGLKSYEAALAPAQSRLTELTKHSKVAAVKTELAAAQKLMADAVKKAAKEEYEDAVALLGDLRDACTQAIAIADLNAGTEPTVDTLKTIGAGKGGAAALDKLVAGMGDKPKAKLMVAALEARFGTKIDRLQAPGKSTSDVTSGEKVQAGGNEEAEDLKRMYQLLLKVPTTHTKDNPSMKKIESYKGPEKGSFYKDTEGLIVISAGRTDAPGMPLGKAQEVPDTTGDYAPVPDDPKKPMKHFDWTTLHEVGHAVDDAKGYMKKHGSKSEYGGWKEYGGDFSVAATAAFAEFKYDKDYIEEFMAGLGPQPVAAPTGPGAVAQNVWDKRRTDFERWYGWVNCSTGNGPVIVGDGGIAKKAALDGAKIVYQESYPGVWTSYEIAARAKGMTGYQFRAPGEFFSELYAAYEIGRMKPGHPAVKWLETL